MLVEATRVVEWHELAAGRVRTWSHRPARAASGHVVVLPGLAFPRYLFPFARELAGRGVETTVLDTLAFRGGRRVEPSIRGLARACAEWLVTDDRRDRVVVVGHSTGAQCAAEVALDAVAGSRVGGLVLAGPTFVPRQRSWPRLALATCTAYRRDSPRELVVVRDALAVRTDVLRLIRSGLAHHLEERLPFVTVPTTLTAGASDSYAPRDWLELLAARTGGRATVSVLPGSHNTVFPHAARFARLVEEAVRRGS